MSAAGERPPLAAVARRPAAPPAGEVGRARRAGAVFGRFLPMLGRHRSRLSLAGAWLLGFIAMDLVAPWPVQGVIDGVLLGRRDKGVLGWFGDWLPADPVHLLGLCCLAVVSIAALRSLFSYGQKLLATSVGHQVIADLRVQVFTRLTRLSLSFHGKRRTGDLLMRLTGDITLLREILVPAVMDFVANLLILSGMLALMASMDLSLTLIGLAMLPLLLLATVRYGGRIREVSREQRRKEGKIAAVAGEALNSVALFQVFSREERISRRFARQSAKNLRAGLKGLRLRESLARVVQLTLAGGSALVLWVGARRSLAGGLSPGELVVFLTYLRGLYKPAQVLVRIAGKASKATACGERVLEVLDSQEEVPEADDAVDAPSFSGEIAFEGVTFGYDPERPVLRDLTFRIAPGEMVGLAGPSGAGKSTLVALLLRLYDPQSGRILVDGVDIRRFRLESYRRQIAIVLQDPFLLGDSAEENILAGRPEATAEEVREAARLAGAHEFLERLPQGYDSVLGERGASLSRGQQQRVSLARAVLRRAPILILDEPTTGLDARTEGEVRDAMLRVASGRTCVWIAHGLSQILDCPRVIVVRDGRVVESGAPSELLASPGAFHGLFGGVAR